MSIVEVLQSEMTLSIGVAVFGTFWTLFKGSNWMQERQRRRLRDALRALEAAVEATYREYVRALKEQNPNGTLTLEEQQAARQHARERAIAIARERGIDLVKELGADFIDLWTSRIVKKLKRAG